MKFTLSWLKYFLDTNCTLEEISDNLTALGLEVEEINDNKERFKDFKIAEIIETKNHPNADKLKICLVDISKKQDNKEGQREILQIICGAPNARSGIKVILAQEGCLIPNGNFKIKKTTIRGVESQGMLCSLEELLLPADISINQALDGSGIVELEDTAPVGECFANYYGFNDPVIEINVTPNRGDALSVYGIARDLAAKNLGNLREISAPNLQASFNTSFRLDIKNTNNNEACRSFFICELKNLNNISSPRWLQNLLHNIGQNPINAVVDVTNYIAYSYGQPMHAYDAAKISGDLFIVETAQYKDNFSALNGKIYDILPDDLIIKDNKKINCLAGLIGGSETSCNIETSNIILEAANFHPDYISKTGRRLRIDSTSRFRFERKIDHNFTKTALKIAIEMIKSICGGEISQIIEFNNENYEKYIKIINFSLEEFEQKAGFSLESEKIISILTKIGCKIQESGQILQVSPPSWRHDINISEDLTEEILRIYGYENIPSNPIEPINILSLSSNSQKYTHEDKLPHKIVSNIKRILAAGGYNEVVTWSFMDDKIAALFSELNNSMYLLNPITTELNYLRPNIIPNLAKIIAKNQARGIKNIKIFEIGPIFYNGAAYGEELALTALCSGKNMPENWRRKARALNFFDLKSDIEILFNSLALPFDNYIIEDSERSYYHPLQSATIRKNGNVIGYLGKIHPSLMQDLGFNDSENNLWAFEIFIDRLSGEVKNKKKKQFTYSDFPPVNRDFSFILQGKEKVKDMVNFIKSIDKNLIKSVEVFDLYKDKSNPDIKSIGFSVIFQAQDHTFTDEEIKSLSLLITEGMEREFSAQLKDKK